MPTGIYPHFKKAPEERFWPKVRKTPTCWFWDAYKDEDGYGRFNVGGWRYAHRFSYEISNGPIPEGMFLDHICRVRDCVNPEHLRVVTNKENVLSGIGLCAINSRKTHCKRNHPLSGNNLEIRDGRRCCLECRRLLGKERRDRQRIK